MVIVTHGSRNFDDYSVFLNTMLFALKRLDRDDKEFTIYSAGPVRVNQMAEEYLNVSNFKARGIKTKLLKINYDFVKQNHEKVDYLFYFCNKGEPIKGLIDFAEANGIQNYVYRY